MERPILIGNVSGSTGDRLDGLKSMLRGPTKVDGITGDWLSEFNIGTRALERVSSGTSRYEPGFLYSLRSAIEEYKAYPSPLRIVVNAGGADPKGLALKVEELLQQNGAPRKIAYITGDDVLDRLDRLKLEPLHREQRETFAEFRSRTERVLSANVYIGAVAIRQALTQGADIVIVGRCTDASPVIALASWWHGWTPSSLDPLAGALAAGHLIECGCYVTGGSFAGFQALGDRHFDLSFPIAEIYNDGRAIIQKQSGQNGIITRDTVRTQFVYELQGLHYLNPDVVADLSEITMEQYDTDKVLVSGVRGLPPPPTLKIAVTALAGYQAEFLLYITGRDGPAKVESFRRMAHKMIDVSQLETFRLQLCGLSSESPRSQAEATTILRVMAKAKDAKPLSRGRFLGPLLSNQLQGYPALTPNLDYRTADPRALVTLYTGLISRHHVRQCIHMLGFEPQHVPDELPPEDFTGEVYSQTTDPSKFGSSSFGPTKKAPLGSILLGRSGDKGANVNVGLFFPSAEESTDKWKWLRGFLTIEKLIEMMGEDYRPGTYIERCEFSNLRAVHFVVHGHLGTGVSSTESIDPLGKGFVEFLRSCVVDIPSRFLLPAMKL